MLIPKDEWYLHRGYLHFDLPISYKKAKFLVTNPASVAVHPFLPLIGYTISSKKVKKDRSTNTLEIKHKEREIAYSSHVDSHIYAYYACMLKRLYEANIKLAKIDDSVLAFRELGKSNIDFASQAFNKIKEFGECSVVALDFSKFFDSLNHDFLKSKLAALLSCEKLPLDYFNVFKSLTKYSKVDRFKLYSLFNISENNSKNGRNRVCSIDEFRRVVRANKLIVANNDGFGIPQGTPISALLSNIYMYDFDISMRAFVNEVGGTYYRYCDDMLFIVPIDKKDSVITFAKEQITKIKVQINDDKTEVRTFIKDSISGQLKADKPLQYLGFMFDGENAYIRSSSLARYSDKLKRGVRLANKTKIKYNSIRASNGLEERSLYKRKLYSRYTHLGGRNFITYGLRAARTMNSKTIKRQLKPLWAKFHQELSKYSKET
ncbi:antiviral reverse transcriptase Drt2 [Plesiomonas shigelloides]|uniref:antiviral reverse transcriptase Drt2 n=1 Tax=Plesiomonas shigelloides TaxID=703 RepID=UPI00387EEC53